MSSTLLQHAAFLAMLYGGALSGIVYDVFRLIRRICNRRAVNVLSDALFLLAATFIAILSFLFASGGAVRPYLCLGFVSGFVIEQWSLSTIFFGMFYSLRAWLFKK